MIKYGLISKLDAHTLECTMELVIGSFFDQEIHTTEVGIFDGETSRGINMYLKKRGKDNYHTAIDNCSYPNIVIPFDGCNIEIGDSVEVAYKLRDESQHMILVDANHSFHSTVADFFCYAPKIRKGGFFLFHDTGKHIAKYKDYQQVGSKDDPNMYISCRKALEAIGLYRDAGFHGFELVFDMADENDPAGGFSAFKRIK